MCLIFQKGDPTLSVLELWGAEYQESNALLLRPADRCFLEKVCQREKCPVDFVGNVTGDGKARFTPVPTLKFLHWIRFISDFPEVKINKLIFY